MRVHQNDILVNQTLENKNSCQGIGYKIKTINSSIISHKIPRLTYLINMMISDKIEELSRNIWDNLGNAAKYKITYGEETITDHVLLELLKQNYHQLKIIKTHKQEESTQGSDWDWFVGSNEYGWIRFSIQAKKHYLNSDTYNIKYTVGKHPYKRYQYEILREYSRINNAVPLYSFYNHYPTLNISNHWHCSYPFDAEILGWSFTTLRNIEHAANSIKKKNFDCIHTYQDTQPMRCLFKCKYFLDLYKKNIFDQEMDFLNERCIKIRKLPESLISAIEIGSIYEFPNDLFKPDIKIYPDRIAIFDVINLL